MNKIQKEMIEEFQCPGCVNGSNVSCCELQHINIGEREETFFCRKHVAGTFFRAGGLVYLGMPEGFDKVGFISDTIERNRTTNIRLFQEEKAPIYDNLNIPVWAMEKDGYLFIRDFLPRINKTYITVIKNGKMSEICPQAINVSKFIDEID